MTTPTKTENDTTAGQSPALGLAHGSPGISEIGELMRTQDNLCTADVFFLVQEKHRDYGYDPQWGDNVVFVDNDGEECAEDDDGATETAYVDRWEYVHGFFTMKGAKDYIATNSHRHRGELRVYGDSLYRNAEMLAVRAALMANT